MDNNYDWSLIVNGDLNERAEVIQKAALIKHRESVPYLIQALNESGLYTKEKGEYLLRAKPIRLLALSALVELKAKEAAAAIIGMTSDPDAKIKYAAILALIRIGALSFADAKARLWVDDAGKMRYIEICSRCSYENNSNAEEELIRNCEDKSISDELRLFARERLTQYLLWILNFSGCSDGRKSGATLRLKNMGYNVHRELFGGQYSIANDPWWKFW